MSDLVQEFRDELERFERNVEVLHSLKDVYGDLKIYKKMIRIKKYD